MNLACTGRPGVAFVPGHYYLYVGDSGSGKTFLCLTSLAEAAISPIYKDHRLIFDNAENGAMMDFAKFFGRGMADRLEPPSGSRESPRYSDTVETFYYNVEQAFKTGEPFIYLLDSMDALTSEEEESHFSKSMKARKKGEDSSGTYGTSRAKKNSTNMRIVFNRLRKDGKSILIIISQTRHNIGFGARFQPKTRGGGDALTFYAGLELWTSQKGHIKTDKKVRGKNRELGVLCKVRVKKNRLAGWDRTVEVPILHSVGIDDVGGMVDYLVNEEQWSKGKGGIVAEDFEFTGSRERLVAHILENKLTGRLRSLVNEVWQDIEEQCKVNRESRYT